MNGNIVGFCHCILVALVAVGRKEKVWLGEARNRLSVRTVLAALYGVDLMENDSFDSNIALQEDAFSTMAAGR